jgi:hypothetical protein
MTREQIFGLSERVQSNLLSVMVGWAFYGVRRPAVSRSPLVPQKPHENRGIRCAAFACGIARRDFKSAAMQMRYCFVELLLLPVPEKK